MEPETLQRVRRAGHRVFDRGRFNLNIVGVRTPPGEVNTYDDWIHLIYKDDRDEWVDLAFRCTTDPGLYWLKNPARLAGTAILKPGQYRGAYKIGLHRGRYPCLKQARPVTVYRDRNRDDCLDMHPESEVEGIYGINIHHSGYRTHYKVDKWSAGCTVLADIHDWQVFMSVINRSREIYGDRFTYTLIDFDLNFEPQ